MFRTALIAAALLALGAPAWATQYAVPDNGNTAADCVPGYRCIDDSTGETFSIGALSFPPPYLATAKPADLTARGILTVTTTPAPSGNFATMTSAIQMVAGVPTQVWTTTPASAQAVRQAAFDAAIAAGLTITCAPAATICNAGNTGVFATTASAQTALAAVVAGVGADRGLPGGGSTFYYLDAAGAPHPFTAAQISELYDAGRDYIYRLDLFVAGVGAQPPATAALN